MGRGAQKHNKRYEPPVWKREERHHANCSSSQSPPSLLSPPREPAHAPSERGRARTTKTHAPDPPEPSFVRDSRTLVGAILSVNTTRLSNPSTRADGFGDATIEQIFVPWGRTCAARARACAVHCARPFDGSRTCKCLAVQL